VSGALLPSGLLLFQFQLIERERSTRSALARFLIWDFSSWQETTRR